jgi:hypothetical protein
MKEFLKELAELTNKHKFSIGGCGCCGSPFLSEENKEGVYYLDNEADGLTFVTYDKLDNAETKLDAEDFYDVQKIIISKVLGDYMLEKNNNRLSKISNNEPLTSFNTFMGIEVEIQNSVYNHYELEKNK